MASACSKACRAAAQIPQPLAAADDLQRVAAQVGSRAVTGQHGVGEPAGAREVVAGHGHLGLQHHGLDVQAGDWPGRAQGAGRVQVTRCRRPPGGGHRGVRQPQVDLGAGPLAGSAASRRSGWPRWPWPHRHLPGQGERLHQERLGSVPAG